VSSGGVGAQGIGADFATRSDRHPEINIRSLLVQIAIAAMMMMMIAFIITLEEIIL